VSGSELSNIDYTSMIGGETSVVTLCVFGYAVWPHCVCDVGSVDL
jgi:hypothetical protein